ncbi:hypothetical protein WJX72_007527 [[Myrmecia] bisecta]|uniref:Uncharacterized protein n=1 Tax=[Myrmecia] bisecta TaxID=41462 RepID=A0AAW1R7X6_9CHLO
MICGKALARKSVQSCDGWLFAKRSLANAGSQQAVNVLVRTCVSSATYVLRLLRVGAAEHSANQAQPVTAERIAIAPGDVAALKACIQADYLDRCYIITGQICDGVYDDNCYFADPTVSFSGLQTWQRNLQLLVPFLEQPSLELLGLEELPVASAGEPGIKAQWKLQTYLKLPWRPFIDVLGTTLYTLNDDATKVVKHVEAWNISGLQALQQVAYMWDTYEA